MKAATNVSKWGVFSLLLVLSVSLAATAQGPPRPQRPEPSPRLLDEMRPRALTAEATSSAGTIYVETFGTDSTRCGTQRLPCRTINYGLLRAQQIQPDPFVWQGEQNFVTVRVGPGTYNERVVVTGSWIWIQGAGAGNTIITAGHEPDWSAYAVLVYGQGIHLDGLTFSASDVGVFVLDAGEAYATHCSFVDNWDTGFVVANAYGFVQYSTFTNNVYGGAYASNARMHLWDVTMTGTGTEVYGVGVTSTNAAAVVLQSTDPNSPVTISNYMDGIDVYNNAFARVNYVTLTGNYAGMYVDLNSSAQVTNSTVSNNSVGIYVNEDSFLRLVNAQVSDNTNEWGIYFSLFSHGRLRNVTFSNNGPGDIYAEPGSDYHLSP